MTTLHIIRQSAYNTNDFAQCIEALCDDDKIVFIDDGCYNIKHHLIKSIKKNVQLNIIEKHSKARAICIDEAVITKIAMNDLVALTFENKRVVTWQ